MLWLRKLVLLFMVPNMDGSRGRLLAQWCAVCLVAISCGTCRKPGWRATGRQAYRPLGHTARAAMGSSGLPDGDGWGADRHGALPRKNRGGCAVVPGLWHDGPDAPLGVGAMPGNRRAI